MKPLHAPRRGFGLLEAVVALALLAFGLLGLVRMQSRIVANTTEAGQRMAATLLADELLNMMLVDSTHAACYTIPAAGTCTSVPAAARASEWSTRATSTGGLPASATATSTLDAAASRMTVRLSWQFKGGDARTHEVTSDVRANP